ncbi:MAG: hypothetical protein AAGA37_04060 [Actinomycetota bacterium]
MADEELIEALVSAAREALPMILDATEPNPKQWFTTTDIEVARTLVASLIDHGFDQRSLMWTAELLELTANVMVHHRHVVSPATRSAWAQVTLLFRTAGLAFAEAVGRVPGTAAVLRIDEIDVTRAACESLASVVDYGSVREMLSSLEEVAIELPNVATQPSFSSDVAELVADWLTPAREQRRDIVRQGR